MDDHTCGLDGEQRACIGGAVYGPCDHEGCGGVCDYEGDCDCECHAGHPVVTVELPGISR